MRCFISFAFICFFTIHTAAAKDNVHFSGALVAEPCLVPDEDTDIRIDFGTVIKKYLYQYQRTKSQPFMIHLVTCDPSILSTVSVTFDAVPDSELNDLVMIDATSIAQGVTIGIELANGDLLPVNKASPYTQLSNGNNVLTFGAFVQARPTVIENKTLIAGDFSATTTFILAYQ
ncbi:type 1 fimbrial protein [Cronobacter sakazakii]|nr:type 1 fimbrial protein [Cronobacter sakazakii]ELY4403239.1 type 1 fimbrial protein [Cronobacter sakazakii]ELY4462135.1 type 1 fimbrial protein [Cronobacter sakazakii]ELY5895369.1 type 1 fimbrial protein [Cronobacter sakazakii]